MSKAIYKDLKNATADKIKDLLEESQGQITGSNLEALGELIDIHKDITNEEYWCYKMEEGEMNMYGNYGRGGSYGNYGRGGSYNEGYGEYNERGYGEGYGARGRGRGSRGRYRGHDSLDEMYENYGRYSESRERYGASQETDKSFHYMVKALEDFIKVLEEEADTPQQKEQLMEALQNAMR